MEKKMEKYIPIWEKLGLDTQAMINSCKNRRAAYDAIFPVQKNRPKKTAEFCDNAIDDFVSKRVEELYNEKQNGKKLIGLFCVYVPDEITLAFDAISMGLCAGAEAGFIHAEKYLPRNTCSLIKSFFGLTALKICPFIEIADVIVGETTCDGKKKAYDIYKDIKNMYIMELPNCKSNDGKTMLFNEYTKYVRMLEELTGQKLTPQMLKDGISKVNNKRRAMSRILETRKAKNPPISGLDALFLHQMAPLYDTVEYTGILNTIADELEERVKNHIGVAEENAPRLLMTGCPTAVPNWKVTNIVEKSGGIVVSEEGCVGLRAMKNETSQIGETIEELLKNITERYFTIDCACFSENTQRMNNLQKLAKDYSIDGAINYTLMFCSPFGVENYIVEKTFGQENIPSISIETDYSKEDAGQIKLRIEAFLEIISEKKKVLI